MEDNQEDFNIGQKGNNSSNMINSDERSNDFSGMKDSNYQEISAIDSIQIQNQNQSENDLKELQNLNKSLQQKKQRENSLENQA